MAPLCVCVRIKCWSVFQLNYGISVVNLKTVSFILEQCFTKCNDFNATYCHYNECQKTIVIIFSVHVNRPYWQSHYTFGPSLLKWKRQKPDRNICFTCQLETLLLYHTSASNPLVQQPTMMGGFSHGSSITFPEQQEDPRVAAEGSAPGGLWGFFKVNGFVVIM